MSTAARSLSRIRRVGALLFGLALGCSMAPKGPPKTSTEPPRDGAWPAVAWGGDAVEVSAVEVSGRTLVVAGRSEGGVRVGAKGTSAPEGPFIAALDDVGDAKWIQPIELAGKASIHALAPGPGGASYLAGSVVTPDARTECLLGRIESDGRFAWLVTIGGEGHAVCRGVAAGDDGAVRVVGEYDTRFAELPPVQGMNDAMVLVLESAHGDLRSVAGFGGAGDDGAHAIVVDAEGGLAVAGTFGGASTDGKAAPAVPDATLELSPEVRLVPVGEHDGFVVRFDPSGSPVWATAVAGPGDDVVRSIVADGEGFVVAGTQLAQDTAAPEATPGSDASSGSEAFLVGLDASGAITWTWADPKMARLGAIGVTRDRIVAVGSHRDGFDLGRGPWAVAGGTGVTLALFSKDGKLVGGYGCDGPGEDLGTALATTIDGRIVFGGTISPDGGCATVPGPTQAGFVRPMVLDASGRLGALMVVP